jgi:TorA maturation chaperone TorD
VNVKQLEQTEAVLAARRYLYALFQSLFGAEPSSEQFQAISLSLVREAFAILGEGDASTASASGVPDAADTVPVALAPASDAPTTTIDEFLEALSVASSVPEDLNTEYTQLFIGPGKLSAPPWESVYTSGERVIFQRSTLEIRNFYRSQGFIPQLYPKVADDHIALELDFLRLLAERALDAWCEKDKIAYTEALQAGSDFLAEHLLCWIDRFAWDLALSEKSTFYSTLAQTLVTFVNRDRELIPELLELSQGQVSQGQGVSVV